VRPSRAVAWLALAVGCWPASCTSHALIEQAQERLLERAVTVDGTVYRYRVFLPRGYSRSRAWPVVLFLHGSDERGDDNAAQATAGLGPVLLAHPRRVRAIVVLPQCRKDQQWVGPMARQALAALEQTVGELHGDPRRLYLTGISMGGSGAWYLARDRRFAAVAPVCGEVEPEAGDPLPANASRELQGTLAAADPYASLARQIAGTPVWAFHGADDDQVPVEQSRRMVAALAALGSPVRYTEYPKVGHDAWDLAYSTPELWRWMLAQRRPPVPGR
jgi:predicted peptidase